VSQNIGAGNVQRAARVATLGAASGFVILTLVGVIAYTLAPVFVAFFVPNDPEVIAEGAQFIRVMCLTWGGIGVQLCIVSAFRASGNMLMSMVIALVAQFVFQFPLAYVLSMHTGLHAVGVWWSFPITNMAAALVAAGWFAQGGWKKTRLTEEDKEVARVADETILEDGIR
jgi:Na+-driven multidrug efflux pump